MTFALGKKSLANSAGVHPDLMRVIGLAIGRSAIDFGIQAKAVRTLAEQRKLMASGASQTLQSRHLEHVDFSGRTKNIYGHAVDLVPWVDGEWSWDWDHIWAIAAAMASAATDLRLGHEVCWGGVWDRWVGDYAGDERRMRAEVEAYKARHAGSDFLDGPHFQIYRIG